MSGTTLQSLIDSLEPSPYCIHFFIGVHGVGKTTYWQQLQKTNLDPDSIFIPEYPPLVPFTNRQPQPHWADKLSMQKVLLEYYQTTCTLFPHNTLWFDQGPFSTYVYSLWIMQSWINTWPQPLNTTPQQTKNIEEIHEIIENIHITFSETRNIHYHIFQPESLAMLQTRIKNRHGRHPSEGDVAFLLYINERMTEETFYKDLFVCNSIQFHYYQVKASGEVILQKNPYQ